MRIESLHLKKLKNTRDLGGFPTESGKKIKHGKLIRSGRLFGLPEKTVKTLEKIGVTTIVDMRIDAEKTDYPSTKIEGARTVNLPLVTTATTGITHTKSMASTMLQESKRIKTEFGSADNYMKSVYEIILFTPDSQEKLKKFFQLLKDDENCFLWHCNAGKDRTGIAAMLIEGLLGVDESLIIEDYVISNKFQRHKRTWQKLGLYIAPIPLRFKQILFALMKAKPQYIRHALESINSRYGSITEYCKQALGLSDSDVEYLKDKYLE